MYCFRVMDEQHIFFDFPLLCVCFFSCACIGFISWMDILYLCFSDQSYCVYYYILD